MQEDVEREVRRALALLHQAGDVVELRVPHAGRDGTISGYYDDPSALVHDVLHLDERRDLPGIYVTANAVAPALLARAVNRAIERAKLTTSDADVPARRWLLVDLDAVRPAGISSTDGEHDAALALAREAEEWLARLGVPRNSIVLADSGNGAHLLVRVELPNAHDVAKLCKRCLTALDLHLSTDRVHVDTTTANAARIWKLYGTMARKGDATPDRPHRRARLLHVPEIVATAPREVLERLAMRAPTEPERDEYRGQGGRLDVARWLAEKGIDIARTRPWQGGTLHALSGCPMDTTHERDEAAYVIQYPSGAIAAGCHHARCEGWGWRELRARYEPVRGRLTSGALANGDAPGRRARLVCVGSVKPEVIDWLWSARLARAKMTLLAGDPGAGKTFLALAITAGLTRGRLLPGEATGRAPVDVVYMTREDGVADTLRPRLDALDADVARVHVLVGAIDGAPVNLSDIDVIGSAMEDTGAGLVVVDPVQSWLGASVDAHRANETRPVLDALGALCERQRCACLIIAHTAKARGMRAVAAALGSIDFAGAARVMLIAGADPHERGRSVLAGAKSNIGPMPGSIAYVIDRDAGGFTWAGPVDLSAADILAGDTATEDDRNVLNEAVEWLREELANGPRPALDMERAARSKRIADATLRRARRAARVRSLRRGFGPGGEWIWVIDAIDAQSADTSAYGSYGGAGTEKGVI